jgi:hypothetical protein
MSPAVQVLADHSVRHFDHGVWHVTTTVFKSDWLVFLPLLIKIRNLMRYLTFLGLLNMYWYLVADVSGKLIGLISKVE